MHELGRRALKMPTKQMVSSQVVPAGLQLPDFQAMGSLSSCFSISHPGHSLLAPPGMSRMVGTLDASYALLTAFNAAVCVQ